MRQILRWFSLQSRKWLRRHVKRTAQKFLTKAHSRLRPHVGQKFPMQAHSLVSPGVGCCDTNEVAQFFVCCSNILFIVDLGGVFLER